MYVCRQTQVAIFKINTVVIQVIHDYDKLGIQVLLAAPARKQLAN